MDGATADRTLVDSRGSSCPGPITDLAMAYRRAKVGDVIELWATDLGVKADVRAWAAKTGNEIVSMEDRENVIVTVLRIVKR
ncbi:MAG TPA: sulfurtransferase TusA family protein [bacterium]|nr:sulfurtransferase TusA family protein [bacterium]